MNLQDISFPTTKENILFDDVLLALAEEGQGGEVLRFWESSDTAVVLGRIGQWEHDVHVHAVRRDNIMVLRRSSGGGTVVQGPGCLNFSFILSKDRHTSIHDLKRSYQYILSHVMEALSAQGFKAEFKPISDLAVQGSDKKFSGNAQKRGRKFILHHGTILYDFDLELVAAYLKFPKDVPEYRRGRSHLDFVANIPVEIDRFKKDLGGRFGITTVERNLGSVETEKLMDFLENKDVTVNLAEFSGI